MEEDDGAALDERRAVPPETEHVAEPQRGGGDRVEGLAGQLEALPGERDDERLERRGDLDAPDGGAAHEGLGVRDERWPGERRDDIERSAAAGQHPAAKPGGQHVQQPTQRRVRDAPQRVGIPRIAAMEPRLARVVEDEREPEDGHGPAGAAPRAGPQAAIRRRPRPRAATGCALGGSLPGRSASRSADGTAVQARLGRTDRHDDVGLDERGMDAHDLPVDGQRVEVVRLAVVHDDLAVEVARPVGAEEPLELAATGLAAETGGHEERHAVTRHARPPRARPARPRARRGADPPRRSGAEGSASGRRPSPGRRAVATSARDGPASG